MQFLHILATTLCNSTTGKMIYQLENFSAIKRQKRVSANFRLLKHIFNGRTDV